MFVSLAAAQMDPAMSLYFSFDAIDGDVILDTSGNGNDGMLNQNPETDEGVFGNALKFIGGTRIELDGANFLGTPEDSVTMAVWLNLDGLAQQEIFDCIGTGHASGQYHLDPPPCHSDNLSQSSIRKGDRIIKFSLYIFYIEVWLSRITEGEIQ